jgi:phospholipid/cholesterol/gamma-HCH transport system permease protein
MDSWDTGLLIFLNNLRNFCSRQNISLNIDGLPEGARKLLELASAVPETKDARLAEQRVPFLIHLGDTVAGGKIVGIEDPPLVPQLL